MYEIMTTMATAATAKKPVTFRHPKLLFKPSS